MESKYPNPLNQIKASQKAWQYRHYGREVKVLNFEQWFESQIAQMRAQNIEVIVLGNAVFIKYPGQKMSCALMSEFEEDYRVRYLRQRPQTSFVQGCSA